MSYSNFLWGILLDVKGHCCLSYLFILKFLYFIDCFVCSLMLPVPTLSAGITELLYRNSRMSKNLSKNLGGQKCNVWYLYCYDQLYQLLIVNVLFIQGTISISI
jgi:hypothetical protein